MVEIELLFYVEAQGGAPFEAWFRDLDVKAQGKVTVALGRLKNGGAAKVAGVGDGVFEFKLDWAPRATGSISAETGNRSSCCFVVARRSGEATTSPRRSAFGSFTRRESRGGELEEE